MDNSDKSPERHPDVECGGSRDLGSRDAGHEAVGQALMISIGLAGMLAAARLAEASVAGMRTVIDALG